MPNRYTCLNPGNCDCGRDEGEFCVHWTEGKITMKPLARLGWRWRTESKNRIKNYIGYYLYERNKAKPNKAKR